MSFEINLNDISSLLTEDKLQTLSIDDIAWKGKHLPDKFTGKNCICCGGIRYEQADTKYPCIVVEGMENMYGNKYRMIDGKHRIQKLNTTCQCYVLTMEDICDTMGGKASNNN